MLYAFVKIEGPAHLALEGVTIGHDGGICAEPTEPAKLASIAAITEPDRALTVDALKQGVPFAGALAGGTTYLRISASMDHMCGSETSPTIGIRLRIDGKRVELMRPLDKRLPS